MRAKQCDDDGRVYEDERVGDDDEGWARRVAMGKALAALVQTGEVVAAFQ
jgi:hypothetical protein